MTKFIQLRSALGQEELINKVTELINMDVVIRSKYIARLAKAKNSRAQVTKFFKDIVEENVVSTT